MRAWASIDWVSGNELEYPTRREAVAAYSVACERRGLPVRPDLIHQTDNFDRRAGRAAADEMLAAGASAILALGPMGLVAGVLERMDELGLQVPEDVSVIGYDENELAFVKAPRMTVIGRPVGDLGRLAGRLVISRLATPDGPKRVEVVETRLIIRESSGRASVDSRLSDSVRQLSLAAQP